MKTLPYFTWAVLLLSAQAGATDCKKLEKEWRARYLQDFNIAWDTKEFDCPGNESRLAKALHDLETTTYKPNRSGYAPRFYINMIRNVSSIHYAKECDAIAFAKGKEITLCPKFFKETRESRACTLVHETRHTEENDPGHVICAGGEYKGKKSCDEVFYDGSPKGSGYNFDIVFLDWNIDNGSNDDLSESVLRSEIKALIPDRFNHITAEEIKKWRK